MVKMANRPVDLIPVPSGLSAQFLAIRFASRNCAESKQGLVTGDVGRRQSILMRHV